MRRYRSFQKGESGHALILVLPVVLLLAACAAPSLNMQRSLLRGSGDVAATAYLDHNDDVAPRTLVQVAVGVQAFLESGDVSELPLDELKARLAQLIPIRYRAWGEQLLGVIDTQSVDVRGTVGVLNARRLEAFVIGFLRGAEAYERE